MNFFFRLLLTFNATSLLVIIFLVQKGHTISYFLPEYADYFDRVPSAASYIAYLLVPVILTRCSIALSNFLGKDSFEAGQVDYITLANNSFLPSYLGYFFVALSINNWDTLFFVYGVVFVFTFLSQALYFNPLFLLFKFDFYNITTRNGADIFLISQNRYKLPNDVELNRTYRINDYTFIEKD